VKIPRRKFLTISSVAAAAALSQRVARSQHAGMTMSHPAAGGAAVPNRPLLDLTHVARYVDPLPVPAVLQMQGTHPDPEHPRHRLPYAEVVMRESFVHLHRDLPPTRAWTYNGTFPGPTIVAQKDQPLLVRWTNSLPFRHFLPVDFNMCGAERSNPEVRSVVHLHGGKTPHESDGYPENWYTPGKSALYRYPNAQDAATLWYHDHAMGINRLNTYAGMFGFYLVQDPAEDNLNLPTGSYDIPIVIADRLIDRDGQFFYPTSGVPDAPWVPEVFGNAIPLNGKLFPYFAAEPRAYRFRLLNAANGRFFNLTLSNGYKFKQIGSDQGLLAAPVELDTISIAPAERVEFVIDFAQFSGKSFELLNDNQPILQMKVAAQAAAQPVAQKFTAPAILRTIPRILESSAVQTRDLTLHEIVTLKGETMRMLLGRKAWRDLITENPRLGTTEIWNLINHTEDSHPIHIHMVRFQILDRRKYDVFTYQNHKRFLWTGPVVPPEPGETGWKDTVRAHPAMVTRIIIPFDGYAGRYAWHCHLLEHEANEMMRPIEVLPA
jgi:spore coat protein A